MFQLAPLIASLITRAIIALVIPCAALADPAQITNATTSYTGMGWRFDITVAHHDTGWDHFANAWEIIGPDGARLGIRELLHPHIDEQPFTRSLNNVMIPDGIDMVYVRAKCSHSGWTGDKVRVDLHH